jgi:hypothetical protein
LDCNRAACARFSCIIFCRRPRAPRSAFSPPEERARAKRGGRWTTTGNRGWVGRGSGGPLARSAQGGPGSRIWPGPSGDLAGSTCWRDHWGVGRLCPTAHPSSCPGHRSSWDRPSSSVHSR